MAPSDGTPPSGFTVAPALFRSLGHDRVKDFAPLTTMASAPLLAGPLPVAGRRQGRG